MKIIIGAPPTPLRITMSASRKIQASADLSWRAVYKRLKEAVAKHLRVTGQEPGDDVGFKDTLQHTDEFHPTNNDSQLERSIKEYSAGLAEGESEGPGNQMFSDVADAVYNCLEEIMGKVEEHYGNKWNHGPGYVAPKKIEWVDAKGKATNDEALSNVLVFHILGIEGEKRTQLKKAPLNKQRNLKAKGLALLPAVLKEYKTAAYPWQAPVLKVLEQIKPKMNDRAFHQCMDELWGLYHNTSKSIFGSIFSKMASAYSKAGGKPTVLKKLIGAVEHYTNEKASSELEAEFSKLLPDDSILKEFRSAANGFNAYMGM